MQNYQNYLEILPGKRGGKPCVVNSRITVCDILAWLSHGMTPEEIMDDYPELKLEHVRACLAYAADKEQHSLIVNVA